jgi:tripartite-type tricarboxylate transporter receptor subunit TctC
MWRRWGAIVLLVVSVAYAGDARAEYPDRAIRLIVPFAPGGANDSVARLLADKLAKRLGQAVVVDNRPGGGTVVGTATVANAAPDGYTLLLVSPAHTINPALKKSLPYQTLTDFTPISQITRSAYVLITAPTSPFKSINDLAVIAHASTGQFSYASSGTGSAPHLAGALLASLMGVTALHVPYQGGGPAMIGVIRGDVDLYFSGVAGARSSIESGQVRAIAVSGDRRLAALPAVPTVAEAGVSDYAINGWYGIVGPANLPPDVTSKLNTTINECLKDPELVARLEQEGEEVVGSTPEQFAQLLGADLRKYKTIVASAGLQPQ